ncbi:hypothetical protein BOTBODRAFT_33046 [Botryobasidium botryosum FD-172 SS1]|uniref:Uncharacterized protein n=1 Tax=Botryobasidium botryosum (strain FD-172 SS1) TaxID=930990 RepID=A0A067MEG6_BOTB1|nr:hypothetical protein BOTBODRAFT_33046 [Botryobasidium botryosum FD-172 SS1]
MPSSSSKPTSSPSPSSTNSILSFNIQLSHPRFLTTKEVATANHRLHYINEGAKRFASAKASYMEKAVRRNIIDFRNRLCLPTIPQSCEFDSLVKINSETALDFIVRSLYFIDRPSLVNTVTQSSTYSVLPKDCPYRNPTPEHPISSTALNLPPVPTRSPSPKHSTPLMAPTPIRPINPNYLNSSPRSPPPRAKSPSSPPSPSPPTTPATPTAPTPTSSSPSSPPPPPSSPPSPSSPSPSPSASSSVSVASTIIIDGFTPYSAPGPDPIPATSIPTYAQIASNPFRPARPIRITQRRLKESSEMETIRASFNNHPLARRPLPRAPPPTPTSENVRKEAFKNHSKSVNKSLTQIKEAIRSNRAAAEKHKTAPVAADPSPPIATPPPQFPNPSNVQGFFSPPTGTKGYAPLLIPFSALALLFASLDKET